MRTSDWPAVLTEENDRWCVPEYGIVECPGCAGHPEASIINHIDVLGMGDSS
jgi:hypothetical protein